MTPAQLLRTQKKVAFFRVKNHGLFNIFGLVCTCVHDILFLCLYSGTAHVCVRVCVVGTFTGVRAGVMIWILAGG